MEAVTYAHIEISEAGIAYITGTPIKVVQLVLDHLAYHWDAEALQRQHPQLSLGQVHSALAYYYDHRAEVDADIKQRLERASEIRAAVGESPNRQTFQAFRQQS